jgi:hypothetical protein
MSKFNVNEVVLYQNGDRFELGIVKEVLEREVPDFPSDAEQTIVYEYRVWFHTGDTSALTPEHCLHKIANSHAFTILRKQADTCIQPRTCRELAIKILYQFPFELLSQLHEYDYYALEDWLVAMLERKPIPFPKSIEKRLLKFMEENAEYE